MAAPTKSLTALTGWGGPEDKDDSFVPGQNDRTYRKPTRETLSVDKSMSIIGRAGRGLKDSDCGLGSSKASIGDASPDPDLEPIGQQGPETDGD